MMEAGYGLFLLYWRFNCFHHFLSLANRCREHICLYLFEVEKLLRSWEKREMWKWWWYIFLSDPSYILAVIQMSSRPDPRLCDPGGAGFHPQYGNMYIDFWSSHIEHLINSCIELQLIPVGNSPLSAFRNAELKFGNLVCCNWRQNCQLCFTYIYIPFIEAVWNAGMLLKDWQSTNGNLQIQLMKGFRSCPLY